MQPFSSDRSLIRWAFGSGKGPLEAVVDIAMAIMMQRGPSVPPQTGREARLMIRRGQFTGPTSGLAPDYGQGTDCGLLARRVAAIGSRRRYRYPHRPAALPGVAPWRHRG